MGKMETQSRRNEEGVRPMETISEGEERQVEAAQMPEWVEDVKIPITKMQADLLLQAHASARAAEETAAHARVHVNIFTAVLLAGHGLASGQLCAVDTTQDPPILTVKIAAAGGAPADE